MTGLIKRTDLGCRTAAGHCGGRDFRYVVRPDGCHECVSHRPDSRSGYTRVGVVGRLRRLHQLVYEMTHAPIGAGLVVRHKCDNPRCINPDHLLLGTQLDNIRDRAERGKARPWNPWRDEEYADECSAPDGEYIVLGGMRLRLFTLRAELGTSP